MNKKADRTHKTPGKSALSVNEGIDQPAAVNRDAFAFARQKRKKIMRADQYVDGILNGDTVILSQAITLLESSRPDHFFLGQEVLEKCLPHSGKSIRVGITGVPGVGKSTFIEELGILLTGFGKKLAVLAIDPSSERSGGSILGDKTRMEKLATDPHAFIRPSPAAGTLGGVARKTRETITLCEAAGFDMVFVETVGVGQSETAVHSMVDFFLLLMLSGSGDVLQGIKRGIMEMADVIAVTKADGDNKKRIDQTLSDFKNALHLLPPAPSGWTPVVMACSALKKQGLDKIWETILEFIEHTQANSWFSKHRAVQAVYWMHQTIEESIKDHFNKTPGIKGMIQEMEERVLKGELGSYHAARKILDTYFSANHRNRDPS